MPVTDRPQRIFLSYAHVDPDQGLAHKLAALYDELGHHVFIDTRITAGQRWSQVIEQELANADAFVVLLSAASIASDAVSEEISRAHQAAKTGKLRILPVRVDFDDDLGYETGLALNRVQQTSWSPDADVELLANRLLQALDDAADRGPTPTRQELATYRRWLADRYRGLSLLGLGMGDARLRLEEVYVPLAIAWRRRELELTKSDADGKPSRERLHERFDDAIELEEIFSKPRPESVDAPHAAVFGHPGAGKTTALLKLLHTCLDAGPAALGLPAGTLPVFLRLRRLRRDDLALSFGALIERQLRELAGKDLPRGLGERLWRRGKLLLLLDGLDELADDALRAEVCRALEWQLAMHGGRGIRALVSCRFTGYGGKVRLGDAFLHLEVRPLSAAQCRQLVHAWFQEAQRAIPDYGEEEARRAAQGLADALDSSAYAGQRLKVLVSSPLLLTLLCVVVLRGGEMPKQRVAFYEQCLRVLLGKWTKIAREREPLLDVDAALAVLRPLAYKLHVEERQDNLSRIELFRELRAALQGLEKKASPHAVLDWLHRETGLLEEYAPQHFGFMHLGLQEYLTALHIAKQGTALLPDLAAMAPQRWWREVAMLLVGLPGHAVFAPFLEALLAGDAVLEHADLLRDLLDEAEEVELEPFLAQLEPKVAVERQAAVLRLLLHRRDPRLVERAAALRASPDADVATLAEQIVEGARGRGRVGSRSFELFLAHHESDREAAAELAKSLRRHNMVLYEVPVDESWQDHLQPILEQTRSVAFLAGPGCGRPWEDRDLGILAEEAILAGRTVLPVLLPGAVEAAELPELFAGASWIDFRQEVRVAAFNEARAARLRRAAVAVEVDEEEVALSVAAEEVDGGDVVPEEPFVDKTTGIRFLWVPGGRFQMGGDVHGDEKPIHWVRLSPFWIGETPVTNEQYSVFLEATGHQEPDFWRDRRFSEPGQPVVGVSWEDARAYGRWLAEVSVLRVDLPSEAQWEMAARGTDGREYPWGDPKPNSRLACFGLDWETDKPATVGSFPDGVGPYGTLDQAGLVWEWCLDVWDAEAYAKRSRAGKEPVDAVTEGEGGTRSIRGGSWTNPAESLRAAWRDRLWAGDRTSALGFRLVVAPCR